MKKLLFTLFSAVLLQYSTYAQSGGLSAAIAKLDQAQTVKDYEQLEKTFTGISEQPAWLAPYYAAF